MQVADLRLEERYVNRDPFAVAAVELADIRTLLAVPMLKEDRLVGGIVIYRQECRPDPPAMCQRGVGRAAPGVVSLAP